MHTGSFFLPDMCGAHISIRRHGNAGTGVGRECKIFRRPILIFPTLPLSFSCAQRQPAPRLMWGGTTNIKCNLVRDCFFLTHIAIIFRIIAIQVPPGLPECRNFGDLPKNTPFWSVPTPVSPGKHIYWVPSNVWNF